MKEVTLIAEWAGRPEGTVLEVDDDRAETLLKDELAVMGVYERPLDYPSEEEENEDPEEE